MKPGDKVQFIYPNFALGGIEGEGLQEYAHHSGQIVTIVEEREDAFQDADGNNCRGYIVKADDGWQGTVWPGELRLTQHPRP